MALLAYQGDSIEAVESFGASAQQWAAWLHGLCSP